MARGKLPTGSQHRYNWTQLIHYRETTEPPSKPPLRTADLNHPNQTKNSDMNHLGKKPTLTLTVDKTDDRSKGWKLYTLQVNNGAVVAYGPPTEPRGIDKGFRSLSCLVIHQTIQRTLKAGKTRLPPDKHQFLSTIWWAAKAQASDPSNVSDWLTLLFGENPFDRFICADGGSTRHFEVWFTEEIELQIKTYQGQRELDLAELQSLLGKVTKRFDDKSAVDPPKLSIDVKRGVDTISTRNLAGSVTYSDEIQILISTNFSAELSVFWFSSDNSFGELFPGLEIELEDNEEPFKVVNTDNNLEVLIPGNTTLRIDTLRGVESCAVLVLNHPLNQKDTEELTNLLDRSLKFRNGKLVPDTPVFKKVELKGEPGKLITNPTSKANLTGPRRLSEWEDYLALGLKGCGGLLYIFHIPNT